MSKISGKKTASRATRQAAYKQQISKKKKAPAKA